MFWTLFKKMKNYSKSLVHWELFVHIILTVWSVWGPETLDTWPIYSKSYWHKSYSRTCGLDDTKSCRVLGDFYWKQSTEMVNCFLESNFQRSPKQNSCWKNSCRQLDNDQNWIQQGVKQKEWKPGKNATQKFCYFVIFYSTKASM